MKYTMLGFLFIAVFFVHVNGQRAYPPQIDEAKKVEFKNVDEVSLNVWIFNPPKHKITDKKPAIVFFFGGGWNGGSPTQFVPQCEYLAARGMVAMVADYRVKSRNGVVAHKCVSDAKSAIRWVREHATELGIDPDLIAAGGGSAGGHLAAATAILPDFDEADENTGISSKPNALALFNPGLVLAPVNDNDVFPKKRLDEMEKRMGVKPVRMSPFHHVKEALPPTIIFHGTDDTTVPFMSAEIFSKKMRDKGNKCILVAYKGEGHGFFNFGRKNNGAFIDSVNKLDKFLVSLGYLKSPPDAVVRQ